MPNLQSWIEEQLKKGYSKKELKTVLSKKNYPKHVISEVDNVVIKKLSKKPSSKPPVFVVIVVFIVVIGISFLLNQEGSTVEPAITQEPTSLEEPSVTEVSPNDLCDEFKETEYTVSCEEAVSFALTDSPGTVENIFIDFRKSPTELDGRVLMVDKEMWLMDINLDSTFYDQDLDEVVNSLRIGVNTDTILGIYRESII